MDGNSIIFVNQFFWPDETPGAQFAADLSAGLAARGDRVTVITSRLNHLDRATRFPKKSVLERVRVIRMSTPGFLRRVSVGRLLDNLVFLVLAGIRLYREAGAGHTVVLMNSPPNLGVVLGWVARHKGARQVNWLQDLYPEVAEHSSEWNPLHWAFPKMREWRNQRLQSADANVVVGHGMRAQLEQQGIAGDKLLTIPNWAPEGLVDAQPLEGNRLRESWGVERNFVVAYSGDLDRSQIFKAMLDAAFRMKDEPRVMFLFIGGGEQRQQLESGVAALGLTNVGFHPHQPRERLGESLGAADLHVVTQLPETEGTLVPDKVYGVLAAGRPLAFLGSANGEVAQILEDRECGFTVAPRDGLDLSVQIMELVENPEKHQQMCKRARELFELKYTLARAVAQWQQVLNADLSSKPVSSLKQLPT